MTRTFSLRLATIAMVFLGVVGCGNKNGTVKVAGTVTFQGEQPPGPGTISFTVETPASGFPSRPAMAKFDEDGKYAATSYSPGDGLVPAQYKVAVECYETPPNMDGKPVKSYIADKFMNGETSGLELNVEPGSKAITFDIELE